jgi:hypothetical protein
VKPKLTIGMATYDDFDGVYFSVQAIRLYHPEILNECEILVVDNNPGNASAQALLSLADSIPLRYIAFDELSGNGVKDIVFREARGEYVLCMDCHVLFPPGTLRRLLHYFEQHPDTPDLLQGPLISDDLEKYSTHFEPVWSNGALGAWACDPRGQDAAAEPFEIEMQGMGIFACRKSAWPGLNPRFNGFAIEEGYVHEKFRRVGGRCLCLPFLRWVHRFARPNIPYRFMDHEKFRNFMIAFEELGWDFAPAQKHWGDLIGEARAKKLAQGVRAVLRNPFYFFDGVFCIRPPKTGTPWEESLLRLQKCQVRAPIRRIDSLAPEADAALRQILTHREIIARADAREWNSVLIFDEEIEFSPDTVEALKSTTRALGQEQWSTFPIAGSHFQTGTPMQATAYHKSAFSRILSESPKAEFLELRG